MDPVPLSSSQRRVLPRHETSHFTEAQLAEIARDPYEWSPNYAHFTAGVIAGIILFFGLVHVLCHLRATSPRFASLVKKSALVRKVTAGWGYLSAKQQRIGRTKYRFPVLGVGLLLLAFFVFMFTWTWSVRPYYRSAWNVGSPPLAMRSGFMALGCFPFIMAFGSKFNFVTFITGVSHEKLQVYHHFMSWLFLFLSLVHTFPFVMAGMREIKPDTGGLTQLEWSWHVAHKVYYWSGTALLVLLTWLCCASFTFIRRRYYEAFKWLHIISALLFLGFFFVHCNRLLGSWDYLYATTILYGLAVVGRFAYMFIINGASVPRARFEILGGGMVKLIIRMSPYDTWRPGQHYFINFPTCQPFQSHPFTVANMPAQDEEAFVHHDQHHHHSFGHDKPRSRPNEVHLLIREASGLTKKLASHLAARSQRSVPVLLDGPYGGVSTNLAIYEHVVLIAGGAGVTFIMPVLQDLVDKMSYERSAACKVVDVVWSVKETDHLEWMRAEFEKVAAQMPAGCITLHFHVTQDLAEDNAEKEGNEKASSVTYSRIDVKRLVASTAKSCSTLGVVVCGPESLVFEVRNAVADEQKNIITSTSSVKEVFLHSEEYSW